MNKNRLEIELKKLSIDLITDLSTIFNKPSEKDDLIKAELYYNTTHQTKTMQGALKYLLPYKSQILKRNIEFFETNTYIFDGLPEDRLIYYKETLLNQNKNKRISTENMDIIWDYLEAMIECAESYKKLL